MFYRIACFICSVIFHIRHRIHTTGHEHIPLTGGFILCANHASAYDPILIAISMKRPLYFMAKQELFQNRLLALLFHHLHAFPVDRKAVDISTFKTTLSILKRGQALLLFSQGTRMQSIDTKDAKSGVALFALKAGVPVIPAFIRSDYTLFSDVSIAFGQPIVLEAYQNRRLDTATLNKITELIMGHVQKLDTIQR